MEWDRAAIILFGGASHGKRLSLILLHGRLCHPLGSRDNQRWRRNDGIAVVSYKEGEVEGEGAVVVRGAESEKLAEISGDVGRRRQRERAGSEQAERGWMRVKGEHRRAKGDDGRCDAMGYGPA